MTAWDYLALLTALGFVGVLVLLLMLGSLGISLFKALSKLVDRVLYELHEDADRKDMDNDR